MRAELQTIINDIEQSLTLLRRRLDWDTAVNRLDEINSLTADADLWNNPERAQNLLAERNRLEESIQSISMQEKELKDTIELLELAEAENDEAVLNEGKETLEALQHQVQKSELEALLSGEADHNDTFLELHAGAGGTEAQDWTEMLLRMYTRWAEKHGYKTELLEQSDGEEAGIKSAVIRIRGHNAFGWLKTESGVHRLVRISPFDSNARRHTSFASAWVYPVIDDTIKIDINPADCKIDTYRSSGAGGQHVNKTESAVRITHLPTGIVVSCQTQRSQFQNKDTAWSMLRARLYELELKKREEQNNAIEESKSDIGWGYQIRSYVLQPYQMVKDLRTEAETSNVRAVLDGDIDLFLEASLAAKVKE
ncbi:MAG: peptide chain release factor 2 [Alphaproteobacteria bacterium]|nr:peptide chain release factor 2 [Alphaproteobacteria bacterium]